MHLPLSSVLQRVGEPWDGDVALVPDQTSDGDLDKGLLPASPLSYNISSVPNLSAMEHCTYAFTCPWWKLQDKFKMEDWKTSHRATSH